MYHFGLNLHLATSVSVLLVDNFDTIHRSFNHKHSVLRYVNQLWFWKNVKLMTFQWLTEMCFSYPWTRQNTKDKFQNYLVTEQSYQHWWSQGLHQSILLFQSFNCNVILREKITCKAFVNFWNNSSGQCIMRCTMLFH